MARYDKFDPIANGFRAHVAADYLDADLGKIFGVGLDTTGKVVKGGGNSGVVGVLVVTCKPGVVGAQKQISSVDVMQQGCVTDFGPSSAGLVPGTDFGVAGTKYYADPATGIVSTTAAGGVYVGTTVEPDRLQVNVNTT